MPLLSTLDEVRTLLKEFQNPLFLFDNDPDGLCSYLLLRRFVDCGTGVPIKSFPELTPEYLSYVSQYSADAIVILDKPLVSKAFLEEAHALSIPVLWIDHHDVETHALPKNVSYYNPLRTAKPENIPTTALAFMISRRNSDLWLSVVGSIADHYIPAWYDDFLVAYPDLSIPTEDPFEVYYTTPLGTIVKLFSYGLKDKTSTVAETIRFLETVRTPYDVFSESEENTTLHARFSVIDKRVKDLVQKAIASYDPALRYLLFEYGGDLSVSSDVSNELSFRFPDTLIFVCYRNAGFVTVSARGTKVRDFVVPLIEAIPTASGGGHENAVGARFPTESFGYFKERVTTLV